MVPYNTPSPTVKTLNNGTNVDRSSINQENHSPKFFNQPHESPSRYPHSIYRSSSLYPSVNPSASYTSTELSKNQVHQLQTSSTHNYTNPSLEVGQTKNSPSYQTNPLALHSMSRSARDIMPVTNNQRPPADVVENSVPPSSRYHLSHSQTKGQETGSHKSLHTDIVRSRMLDVPNSRATSNDVERIDPSSRIQDSSPGAVPVTSLLFSKATDHVPPYESLEQKGSSEHPSTPANHPSRDLEKHEPRLITPRVQKYAELPDDPHKKSNSLDVVKSKPLEEVHKKSPSLDAFHPKSNDQARHHEIWYPPVTHRDDDNREKARSQPISATEPVATKDVSVALPVINDRGTTTKRNPEQTKAGRKSPNITNMKVYRYLREKRNRTISAVSMEAQDGTAVRVIICRAGSKG